MTVSSDDIEEALYHAALQGCRISAPRYTPVNWWEMDFVAVTEAGYAREYEIKLSHSDFLADFKKVSFKGACKQYKHKQLADGRSFCKNFTFVCPEGVISIKEIPEYAGLMYAVPQADGRVILQTAKRAPNLPAPKVSEEVIRHLLRNLSYRFWDLHIAGIKSERASRGDGPAEVSKLQKRCRDRYERINKIKQRAYYMRTDIRRHFSSDDEWGRKPEQRRYVRRQIVDLRDLRKKIGSLEKLQEKEIAKLEAQGVRWLNW